MKTKEQPDNHSKNDPDTSSKKSSILLRIKNFFSRNGPITTSRESRLITRREFLTTLLQAGAVMSVGMTVGFPEKRVSAQDTDSLDSERIISRSAELLRQRLDELLGNSYSGFSLRLLNSSNEVEDEVTLSPDRLLPVASAFKSAVLLYYLTYVPKENWQLDKGTMAYNVIVYSHNRATGNLLHLAAQAQRRADSELTHSNKNDVELFNDFLKSLGLEGGWLSAWDFESNISGQRDTRYANRTISVSGRNPMISNLVTARDLMNFYASTVNDKNHPAWVLDPEILQTFRFMCGIIDPQYQSPFERSFYGYEIIGKDGYLEPDGIEGFLSARVDAGAMSFPDGHTLVIAAGTFNISEAAINSVYEEVKKYVENKAEAGQLLVGSVEPPSIVSEKLTYFYPENERISGSGIITPTDQQISDLNGVFTAINGSKPIGGVVTVNLYDGSVALFELNDEKPQLISEENALVGKRLDYSEGAMRNGIEYKAFRGGSYIQEGVLDHRQGQRDAQQHTLSFPMIGKYEGTSASNSFGNIEADPITPFWIIKLITGSDENGYSLSNLNSEQTVHAVPRPLETDSRYEHFQNRMRMLKIARNQKEKNLPIPRGFDPYWSAGCINLEPSRYRELTEKVKEIHQQGLSVLVVCSYQGQDDWKKIVMPEGLDSRGHIMYGQNYRNFLGSANQN
jgi:hypothetical protein